MFWHCLTSMEEKLVPRKQQVVCVAIVIFFLAFLCTEMQLRATAPLFKTTYLAANFEVYLVRLYVDI